MYSNTLLKAWIRSFLVGPMVFLVFGLIVFGIAWLFYSKRIKRASKARRIALISVAGSFFLCSFSLVPFILELPLMKITNYLHEKHGVTPTDIPWLNRKAKNGNLGIVVLGGGVNSNMLSNQSIGRLNVGIDLMQKLEGSQLFFSDGTGKASIVTEWTNHYIENNGGKLQNVILETEALTTNENFVNLKPLLKEADIDEIIIVTSARHIPRAYMVARKKDLNARVFPVGDSPVPRFYPDWHSYIWLGAVLNEYVGIVGYKLMGWL